MSFPYNFPKSDIQKIQAFEFYIKSNISWVNDYLGLSYSENVVTIFVSRTLTTEEVSALDTLIVNYVDPDQFLIFDHSESCPMKSEWTNDPDAEIINGKTLVETLILNNIAGGSEDDVLDSFKTIVEYYIPNVSLLGTGSTASINIEIFDITRNYLISNTNVELGSIQNTWATLAESGSTAPNTQFRSTMICGLNKKLCNHDCVWQLRCSTTPNNIFDIRLNSLQYLFYKII
jgi:hypothetical protein